MPSTMLQLRTRRPVDLGVAQGTSTINRRGNELYRRVLNLLQGAASDAHSDSEFVLGYTDTDPSVANTGLALSSASGTVGATLNGVATTVTAAGGDTATAALIAAAINASSTALVKGMFQATNLTATITCSSVVAGDTVEVCGVTFTAVNGSQAGTYSGRSLNTFDMSGNDAADATALAAAINNSPIVSRYVFAVPVSNVVRLFARQFTFASPTFSWPAGQKDLKNSLWSSSGTTLAVSGTALAAGAFVGICATYEGAAGNCMTIAASGTGVTVLNSETRLQRGTGLDGGTITDDC